MGRRCERISVSPTSCGPASGVMVLSAAALARLGRLLRSLGAVNRVAFFSGAPLVLWQAAFFVGPLILLCLLSFWTVQLFQPVADYTTDNWVRLISSDTFPRIYIRTVL